MSTITQFPSGNTQYRIEFDYLARTFVVVTLVNNSNPTMNRVLEVGRDYRFLNPTMIEMLVDQSGFDIVSIHRRTGTDLVVDFRNGSVLTASDLTNSELQAIHIAEEGRDQTVDLAKEYADAAGISAGNAKDSEDEARRIAESIKASGQISYITRRSFEKGFNVITWNEVLLWEEDGEYYRWDGGLPKTVPVGSTPETTGGIGLGAWVSVGDAALRSQISDPDGASRYPELQMARWRDEGDVRGWGAKGDGVTDDTAALQECFNSVSRAVFPKDQKRTYMVSNLTIPKGLSVVGNGLDSTIIKQIAGSSGYIMSAISDDFRLIDFSLNGNYFAGTRYDNPGVINTPNGAGLYTKGRGFDIRIMVVNTAGIGWLAENPGTEVSTVYQQPIDVDIIIRDCGKEGIIFRGPGDGRISRAWVGVCGILPLPAASSTVAMSDYYSGSPVDGFVIDSTTVELGDIHTYAHWSGTGFRTRNNVRLTKGGRVISESNRAQANISQNTYGSLFLDVRNQSLLHPNWTAAVPTYTGTDTTGMPEFDLITCDANFGFKLEATIKKLIVSGPYVVGSRGAVINGNCQTDITYSNSTATSGPESGSLYSGDAVLFTSNHGGNHKVTAQNVNGIAVNVVGAGMRVDFDATTCVTGLKRTSTSNGLRGNNITGSIYRCTTGFVSTGQPASENIDLSMELLTGQVAFSGDTPNLDKAQNWNISASVNNVGYSTRQRLSANLDISTAGAKTVIIPHRFLYTPDFRQVQLTIDDRATPTTSTVTCWVNDITATNIVVGYRPSEADTDTSRANLRVNVMVQ